MMGSTSLHHAAALLAGGVISLTSGDNGQGTAPSALVPAEARAWIEVVAGSREVTIDPLDGMPIIVPDLASYDMPIIPGINTDAMPTLHPDSLGRRQMEVDGLMKDSRGLRALVDSLRRPQTAAPRRFYDDREVAPKSWSGDH